MPVKIEREEGRRLFGLNPQGYADTRPDYPAWIYERLVDQCELRPGCATLEIGPGTGRATQSLLEAGANPMTIVEPDERFAPMLQSVMAKFAADCRLVHNSFEQVRLDSRQFDLVASATAFHWVDQNAGLQKIRRVLTRDGFCALFWNVFQDTEREDLSVLKIDRE
jgi:ubiquinone/menaquinone biosynthesis C-methylase UbiE